MQWSYVGDYVTSALAEHTLLPQLCGLGQHQGTGSLQQAPPQINTQCHQSTLRRSQSNSLNRENCLMPQVRTYT